MYRSRSGSNRIRPGIIKRGDADRADGQTNAYCAPGNVADKAGDLNSFLGINPDSHKSKLHMAYKRKCYLFGGYVNYFALICALQRAVKNDCDY